jgi:O-acetyl-ADP-ribose deacetylase (regulator of RNase III)
MYTVQQASFLHRRSAMRRIAPVAVVVGRLGGAVRPEARAGDDTLIQREMARLQGTWRLVSTPSPAAATPSGCSSGSSPVRSPAMPIVFVSGDLFDNTHGVRAFAHGCNCQGSMGAGVARTFRAHYPEMYEEYRSRCKAEPRRFNLGDCWLWKAGDRPWVFNLGTQEGYWRARASYEAIEAALRRMREQADAEGLTSIAIPRIGVGYGGLSWRKVRAVVEAVFADWPGTLVVYEEFVPGKAAATD